MRLGSTEVSLRQVEAADVVQRRREPHVRPAIRRLQDRQRLQIYNTLKKLYFFSQIFLFWCLQVETYFAEDILIQSHLR